MEDTIIKNIADIGYAGAIAVIGVYFIRLVITPLITYLINKNNNLNQNNSIEKRLKKIEENDLHDLDDLRKRIYKIEDEIVNIRERLTRIETKIKI
jgi:hypothetical protein